MAGTVEPKPEKVKEVDALVARMGDARVVAIANVHGIPARQFQAMRRRLGGKADIRVTRNTLLRLALARAPGKGLAGLAEAVDGQIALVTTQLNPFKLFKELEATKTNAPARGGEVAPADISVSTGETPFRPGPVVGELQKAGIPAAIERGKVVVKRDTLLVKRGSRISREVAHALTRLEIYPLIVGLDLRAACEDGQVYGRDVLAVDEAKVRTQVVDAIRHALTLSVVSAFPTDVTIAMLLSKAYEHALNVSVRAAIPTKDTVKFLLAKAHAQMVGLASRAPGALDDDLRKRLSGAGAAPPPAGEAERKGDKKEDAVSEEDAAAGLGALFG